jgi:hypothetical protein
LQERALVVRPELTQIVLSHCGSFQGTGKTAYAVDMARVVDCMPSDGETGDLALLDPLAGELRQTLMTMSELRVKVPARKLLNSATSIRTKLMAELGVAFDKQAIAEELKALAEQLRGTGEWNSEEIGMGHLVFRTLCEDFRSSALQEALATLGKTGEGDGQDGTKGEAQLINRMGRLDVQPLIVATRFVGAARKVLNVSDKRARMLEEQFRGVDPKAEVQRIQTLFTSLLHEIDSLKLEGAAP